MTGAHALLSASGAARWLNCPGSVAASATAPASGWRSVYADEGSRAHHTAATCLANGSDADDPAIQLYVQTVRATVEPGDTLLLEQRVDLAALEPPVAMYGTADAIVIKPRRHQLHVLDLKYGAGIMVAATNNSQTRYYGLGALLNLPPGVVINTVELTVVQPRLPHPAGPVRREILTALELLAWGRELLAGAYRALAPEAPLAPGPWCQFCSAQMTCPALSEHSLESAKNDFTAYPEAVA